MRSRPPASTIEDSPRENVPGREPGSLARIAARGVGLAGAGYALTQLLNFAFYFVLARLATPADFGHFAAGTLVAGVGTVVGESGMGAALIHRRERVEEAFNSALLATLLGGLGLSLLALASAPLIGLIFHSNQTAAVAAVMSAWLLLRMVTVVPDAWLQRRFSFFRRVVVDPLGVIAFGAASIAAAAAGLGVWALVIGTYASALVVATASWALVSWRPRRGQASVGVWRELARYGRQVVGAELIRRLTTEVPVVSVGRFVGSGALGQYTYALRVAALPLGAVINAGGYVLLPIFSRLSAHDERFRAAFLRALRWLCAISFPAGLILIPLGTPAVVVIFGRQWHEAGKAVMALGGICGALSLDSIASEAWKASGRPDMLPRMHAIALVLTITFVGALLPFGLIGVALGLSLSAYGVAVYATYGVGCVLGIPIARLSREILPPVVASAVMVGALYPVEHLVVRADRFAAPAALLLLAAEALSAAAVYFGMLMILAPVTTSELLEAASALIRRRREARRSKGASRDGGGQESPRSPGDGA